MNAPDGDPAAHGFDEQAMPVPALVPPSLSHCFAFTVAHIRSVMMFCAGVKGRQQATSFFGALVFPHADFATSRRSVFTDSSARSDFSTPLRALRTHCLNEPGEVAPSHEQTPDLRRICPRISPPGFVRVCMTGKQAVEYGLVDEVIVTRPGKMKV